MKFAIAEKRSDFNVYGRSFHRLFNRKVDSKYTLAMLAAKRARELTVPGQNLPEKEVSIALKEIANDTITYERNQGK